MSFDGRLLDYRPKEKWKEVFRYDWSNKKWAIEYVQDVEAIIEDNKQSQRSGGKGWDRDKTMRHAAHIPDIIALKWRNELGVNVFDKNHWPKVKALLNDPEWAYLRTYQWKI